MVFVLPGAISGESVTVATIHGNFMLRYSAQDRKALGGLLKMFEMIYKIYTHIRENRKNNCLISHKLFYDQTTTSQCNSYVDMKIMKYNLT